MKKIDLILKGKPEMELSLIKVCIDRENLTGVFNFLSSMELLLIYSQITAIV